MNEQITKLASKHALYVDGGHGKTNYTFTKESLGEFVQLIVRECIRAYNDDGYQTEYEQDLKVLQHFGVEL